MHHLHPSRFATVLLYTKGIVVETAVVTAMAMVVPVGSSGVAATALTSPIRTQGNAWRVSILGCPIPHAT